MCGVGVPPGCASTIRPSRPPRSEEQRLNSSHLVISYAVFCLKKKIHSYFRLLVREATLEGCDGNGSIAGSLARDVSEGLLRLRVNLADGDTKPSLRL